MPSFASIRQRAARRKGGDDILAGLLPPVLERVRLAELGDDRFLAEMARRIFCSGFAWSVIARKWPAFEEAFLGFQPRRLLTQPPDFWDRLTADSRIVRNGRKIMAVGDNARFIADIGAGHGSFGRFLADWPSSDQIGLMALLTRRGSRLGGNTGQYFLRFVGWDGFILSRDVVACLRDAGLDIAENPTSQKDRAKIQAQFNDWAEQTALPYTHLSRICAMSVGENYTPEQLRSYTEVKA